MNAGNDESRPGGGGFHVVELDGDNPSVSDVAQELRRRRAASLRLPPLESGYRDPFDELREDRLEAWRAAAQHLAAVGFVAVVPREVAERLAWAA